GLNIMRPSELVRRIDEIQKQHDYEPARLDGTTLEIKRIKSDEQSSVIDTFCQSEHLNSFRHRLREVLSNIDNADCLHVKSASGDQLALIATIKTNQHRTEVPIFRVRPGKLAPTLTRNLIIKLLDLSIKYSSIALEFTDPCLTGESKNILEDEGFVPNANSFVKFHINSVLKSAEVVNHLELLSVQTAQE